MSATTTLLDVQAKPALSSSVAMSLLGLLAVLGVLVYVYFKLLRSPKR